MLNKPINPVILGSGVSGQAIAKSLALLALNSNNYKILPLVHAKRGESYSNYLNKEAKNILFIANPSGLHAESIIAGEQAGYDAIICEKPVCVSRTEIAKLKKINIPVKVFHGYRVMWGPRTLHQMINANELGEIFAIECRYWQSSAAKSAIDGVVSKKAWKDDVQLNGPFDTFTDLGSHAIDLIFYLMGEPAEKSSAWLSYANSLSPHRDTHIHLNLQFTNKRHAIASISKTYHGAGNILEISALGTKGIATWRFSSPDKVEIGRGDKTYILRRSQPNPATHSMPFHGMGWLEGYAEIIWQSFNAWSGIEAQPVPTLSEALAVIECIIISAKI